MKIQIITGMFILLFSVQGFATQSKEVKDKLDTAKKVLKFASRNVENDRENGNSKTTNPPEGSGTTKKEYVVRNPDEPWLTNPPYLEDSYSNQYATAKVNHEAILDKLVLECLTKNAKGAKPEHQDFWRDKCKQNAIYKLPRLDMAKRGSLHYVKQEYLPFKKLGKRKFGRALRNALDELSDLRKKTRLVGGLMSTEVEEGELTYEQVNYEICQIEKTVGRVSGKDYCHR